MLFRRALLTLAQVGLPGLGTATSTFEGTAAETAPFLIAFPAMIDWAAVVLVLKNTLEINIQVKFQRLTSVKPQTINLQVNF